MGSKQSTDFSEGKDNDQTSNYGLVNLSSSHSFHWSHAVIAVLGVIAVLALGRHMFKMHKKRIQRRLSSQPSAPALPMGNQEMPMVRISNLGAPAGERRIVYLGKANPGVVQENPSDWEP